MKTMVRSIHEQLQRQSVLEDQREGFLDQVEAQAEKGRKRLEVREAFSQVFPEGNEEAEVEDPWFPDLDFVTKINSQALTDHGQEGQAGIGALRPEVLEGALSRAPNYHFYEDNPFMAAAALAHGIGQSQAFEDGNKRTAYHSTREWLDSFGYGHVSPLDDDDEEFADHLIGYGEGTHEMDDTAEMFKNRHDTWVYANGYGG